MKRFHPSADVYVPGKQNVDDLGRLKQMSREMSLENTEINKEKKLDILAGEEKKLIFIVYITS